MAHLHAPALLRIAFTADSARDCRLLAAFRARIIQNARPQRARQHEALEIAPDDGALPLFSPFSSSSPPPRPPSCRNCATVYRECVIKGLRDLFLSPALAKLPSDRNSLCAFQRERIRSNAIADKGHEVSAKRDARCTNYQRTITARLYCYARPCG